VLRALTAAPSQQSIDVGMLHPVLNWLAEGAVSLAYENLGTGAFYFGKDRSG